MGLILADAGLHTSRNCQASVCGQPEMEPRNRDRFRALKGRSNRLGVHPITLGCSRRGKPMVGEGKNLDFKAEFEPNDHRAKTAMVKDIVAMANSGGGELVFGRNETSSPGIGPQAIKDLDSARVLDYVEKYVEKGLIHLRHDVEFLNNGNALCTIAIEASDYPVVMRKDGTWSNMGISKPVFQRGDVWVRHGSKTERLSQADMRRIVERAYDKGLDRVLSAAQVVRKAGPGSSLEFRTESGEAIRNPSDLLKLALSRRSLNLPHLLSGKELLWLFSLRDSFHPTKEQLELIIESALRRPVTLYWWMSDPGVDPSMMKSILMRLPTSEDRDKSDAASSGVELAAIYLEDVDLEELLDELRRSRYAHFRREAAAFQSRDQVKQSFLDRIRMPAVDRGELAALNENELEEQANGITREALREPSAASSRRLADVTRIIWAKKRGWIE